MNERILFIGGSPCSGKSTVAELIAQEYGAFYFKADELLGEWTETAASRGGIACTAVRKLTSDGIWLREPSIQCEEEFQIYSELAPLIFDKIAQLNNDFIITEGAAYTPQVMSSRNAGSYITIVPSPEFQISRYKEREWVQYVLADCSDKEKAFDNWMQRDVLFAERVKAECEKLEIPCIVNDGSRSVDEIYQTVKELLDIVQ